MFGVLFQERNSNFSTIVMLSSRPTYMYSNMKGMGTQKDWPLLPYLLASRPTYMYSNMKGMDMQKADPFYHIYWPPIPRTCTVTLQKADPSYHIYWPPVPLACTVTWKEWEHKRTDPSYHIYWPRFRYNWPLCRRYLRTPEEYDGRNKCIIVYYCVSKMKLPGNQKKRQLFKSKKMK